MEEKTIEESKTLTQEDILKALEAVEKDSIAIAKSWSSLYTSLRSALSQATCTSVDHMECFSDAVGQLQQSATDAATRGNRFIHSCIRLNEEMKDLDTLAANLNLLKRNVDALDSAVSRLVPKGGRQFPLFG